MKKSGDYEKVCALCEHSCFVEFDESYICKYKNRCFAVEETHSCRHFKFDLLKLSPTPRLPYTADEDMEIILVPPKE